jgi:type II secretory pathway component GspD/PulD (secretin)
MLLLVLPLCLLPGALWAEDASEAGLAPKAFVLTVHEQQLSLRAREASLAAILAQIGRELGIDVVAHIPADETITVTFDQLPIVEALQQLSPNYAYVVDTARGDRSIAKIIVLSKGEAATRPPSSTPPAAQRTEAPRPKPFTFEFDPSKVMQEQK